MKALTVIMKLHFVQNKMSEYCDLGIECRF